MNIQKMIAMAMMMGISLCATAENEARIRPITLDEAITLARVQSVNAAVVQMAVKQVQMDSSLDMDRLEEALEDVGLFAQ